VQLFINEDQPDNPLTVDIRLHKGLLLTNHLSGLNLYDFKTMQLVDQLPLALGFSPITLTNIDLSNDSVSIIRKLLSKVEVLRIKLDLGNKRFV
jgi:hypothetical protein